MRILITGGNGYLGTKLIDKIDLHNNVIKVFSRKNNIDKIRKDSRIYYVKGDLLDEHSLLEATKDIDLVVKNKIVFKKGDFPKLNW